MGIVVDEVDIELDEEAMRFFQREGGFISLKLTTESNIPTKEIFVGVRAITQKPIATLSLWSIMR